MRKIRSLFLFLLAVSGSLYAQAPEAISYQAVVRDAAGKLQESKPVEIQISILQGDASGTTVYRETHASTTNVNGLISLQIGTGVAIDGAFSVIDWSNGPYFVKTEIDLSGSGAGYSLSSVAQLLSVPFALYAKTAGKSLKPDWNATTGNDAEILNKPDIETLIEQYLAAHLPSGNNPGDILFWNNNNWSILPAGLEGQMLTMADGKLAWIDPSFANTNATTYNVGDVYVNAGGTPEGIVVELSLTGRYAKIIALTETSLAWDPLAVKEIYDENGNLDESYVGELPDTTEAKSATDGRENMNRIKSLTGWQTSYPAFAYCAALTGGEWYLPSSNELKLIYENKNTFNTQLADIPGAEPIDEDFYWSSTEVNWVSAYGRAFNDFQYQINETTFESIVAGETAEEFKSMTRGVRAIRRLSWAEATSKPVEKIYAVGDLFFESQNATGIVYEISQGGLHGKVLSLTEEDKVWATKDTLLGASDLDNGLVNQAILSDVADPTPFEAFNWCSALGDGWYLPSVSELFLIHGHKATVNAFLQNKFPGAPQLTDGVYWSSTEKDVSTVYSFDFSDGTQEENTKNTSLKVRAIRTF